MPQNLCGFAQKPLLGWGALEEPTRACIVRIPARVLEMRRQRAADESIKQFIAKQSFDPTFVGSLRAPIKPSAPVNKCFKPRKLPSLTQKTQRIPLHLPETMYERSGLCPAEELARSRHKQKHQALVASNRRRPLHRLRHQEPELLLPQEPIARPALVVPNRFQEMSVLHNKHMLMPHRPSGARPTLLQYRTYQGKPRLGNDAASEDAPGIKTLSTAAVCGSDPNHTARIVRHDDASGSVVQADIVKSSGGCQPEMIDAVSDQTELDKWSAASNHDDYAMFEVHGIDSVDLESHPLLDTEAPFLLAQAAGKSDVPKIGRDAQQVVAFLALHADQLVLTGLVASDTDVEPHRLAGELDAGPAVKHGGKERLDADCTSLGAMHAEAAEVGKATHLKLQIVADTLFQHAAAVDLQSEKTTRNSQPESLTPGHHKTGASASEDRMQGSALFLDRAREAGTEAIFQDIETVATVLAKHSESLSLRASAVNEMELHNNLGNASDARLRHAAAIDLKEMEPCNNLHSTADALFRHAEAIGRKEAELHNNVRAAADALLRHAAAMDLKADDDSQAQVKEAILAEEVDWPPSPGSVAGELLAEDILSQLEQGVLAFADEFDSSC